MKPLENTRSIWLFWIAVGVLVASLCSMMDLKIPGAQSEDQIIKRLGQHVDPEALRRWAMPYLRHERQFAEPGASPPRRVDVDDGSLPPGARECGVTGVYPGLANDLHTGSEFVFLIIRIMPVEEGILVGTTNAVAAQRYDVRIKWRDGIYYVRNEGLRRR